MIGFLDKLREKPESVRITYALLASGGITGVLFLLWAVTLPTRLQEFSAPSSDQYVAAGAAPFDALKQNVDDGFKSIKDLLGTSPLNQENYQPADDLGSENSNEDVAEEDVQFDSDGVIILDSEPSEGLY